MRKSGVILILFMLLLSCSQWGGSNPVGVTGGSNSGYGENEASTPANSQQLLIGIWKNTNQEDAEDYTILTFHASAQIIYTIYQNGNVYDYFQGTYSVNGTILQVHIGEEILTYTFYIQNDKLYLTLEDEVYIYYRM
jgi:hypothetical protein